MLQASAGSESLFVPIAAKYETKAEVCADTTIVL